MDKSIRSIFWILVGLVVLSSLSTIWFFLEKENLYKEYIKIQDTLKTTIERFTSELKVTNDQRLKIQEKLDSIYARLKVIEKERNELKFSHKETLEENASLEKELARLSKEDRDLRKKIADLESEEFLARLIRENAALQVKLERLFTQLGPKEEEINKILSEKEALEQSLKNVEVEKGLLEERLKEQSQIAEVISQDFLREKNKGRDIVAEFEQLRLENNMLKTQIVEAERLRIELQKNLARLNEDYLKKEDEIERIRISLRESQEARAEAYRRPGREITGRTTESVELPPIVVGPERTQIAKATMPDPFGRTRSSTSNTKGKIITVNREHNFVVIDLGERDGVRVGTRCSVYRGGLELGTLEVIQTRERIAAADIKEENTGLEIMPDDTVVMNSI